MQCLKVVILLLESINYNGKFLGSAVSEESASISEEVTASTEEVNATMDELTENSMTLQELYNQLKKEIAQFKIN